MTDLPRKAAAADVAAEKFDCMGGKAIGAAATIAKVIPLAEEKARRGNAKSSSQYLEVSLSSLARDGHADGLGLITERSDPVIVETIKSVLSDPHFADAGMSRGEAVAAIESTCGRRCLW